ncbi:MAG: transglutaminase family protein [Actinobacteria bacterium]|nr:transglutaminase family protein [Actinomycetota bacterium]
MRFDVRYRTVFSYDEQVSESQNELRACPTTSETQRLLDYRVTIQPAARVFSSVDAWGTRVDAFGIRRPHDSMTVIAEASVETSGSVMPAAAPRLEALRQKGFVDEYVEYLQRDRHTDFGAEIARAAAEQVDLVAPDVIGAILAIHRFVGQTLRYTPGSTEVGIAVDDVFAGGVGVCQDYAHLAVAMCRSVGIPARYVSGYLFTERDDVGSPAETDAVVVQTHAWFEAAVPGAGWLGLDPTNGQIASEHHVKIGHGRSYDDVQPLRGVYLGPGNSDVEPVVEIRRVPPIDLWRSGANVSVSAVDAVPADLPLGVRRYSDPHPSGSSIRQQQLQQQQTGAVRTGSLRSGHDLPERPAPGKRNQHTRT